MHIETPLKVTICCHEHHKRRLESIADKLGEAWAELIISRKVEFMTQDMVDMQRAEIDREWWIAARLVDNNLVIQALVHESLTHNTPFYHPFMASIFRQVEQSRKSLILAGLIHAEPLPPSARSKSKKDAPAEAQPGLRQSPSRPSLKASHSYTRDPRFDYFDLSNDDEDYGFDYEETAIAINLDDNLPSNEELGIIS